MGWGTTFIPDVIENYKLTDVPEVSTLSSENSWPSINTQQLVKAYIDVINRNNLKPTHDPYTNPNAHIYYECACGAILDPQTKSFAALNNHASVKGWKIRFTDKGYVPYCVKCGEGVE